MFKHHVGFLRPARLALGVCLVAMLSLQATALAREAQGSATIRRWQSLALLHHNVRVRTTHGTLILDHTGIHFRPSRGVPLNWTFLEIQTFYLAPHELRLKSYANRGWHLPGVKTFRLTLASAVPPVVAAELAACVGKPSRNGDPNPSLPAFATIPARHPTLLGGSNGVLRFDQNGINYVTASGRDSRSWRWADIQTLANPDSYHFRVEGYCETFDFELKQAMSKVLFDRLCDYTYGRGLRLGLRSGAVRDRRLDATGTIRTSSGGQ